MWCDIINYSQLGKQMERVWGEKMCEDHYSVWVGWGAFTMSQTLRYQQASGNMRMGSTYKN